jgi:hypothetical protein
VSRSATALLSRPGAEPPPLHEPTDVQGSAQDCTHWWILPSPSDQYEGGKVTGCCKKCGVERGFMCSLPDASGAYGGKHQPARTTEAANAARAALLEQRRRAGAAGQAALKLVRNHSPPKTCECGAPMAFHAKRCMACYWVYRRSPEGRAASRGISLLPPLGKYK